MKYNDAIVMADKAKVTLGKYLAAAKNAKNATYLVDRVESHIRMVDDAVAKLSTLDGETLVEVNNSRLSALVGEARFDWLDNGKGHDLYEYTGEYVAKRSERDLKGSIVFVRVSGLHVYEPEPGHMERTLADAERHEFEAFVFENKTEAMMFKLDYYNDHSA